MKSVMTTLYELAGKQGWNDATIIELLMVYIDAQQNNEALEDFLRQYAQRENEYSRQTETARSG